MAKIRAIALTTVADILRRRMFYLVLFLLALSLYFTIQGNRMIRMAVEAGELDSARSMQAAGVESIIGLFTGFGAFLSVYFAACALSVDIREKTLAAILARPISRAQYLGGKWVGVMLFIAAFMLIGIAAGVGLAAIYDIRLPRTFWIGVLESFVRVFFLTGLAVSLSVRLPPVVAGLGAFFLTMLPGMVEGGLSHPNEIARWLSTAIYYGSPALMPAELLAIGKEAANPDFWLYARVLIENSFYAVFAFAAACVVFSRRDVPVK